MQHSLQNFYKTNMMPENDFNIPVTVAGVNKQAKRNTKQIHRLFLARLVDILSK